MTRKESRAKAKLAAAESASSSASAPPPSCPWFFPTTDMVASPGPGLSPISGLMIRRINEMVELEKAGTPVAYVLFGDDREGDVYGVSFADPIATITFKVFRQLAEAKRTPRAVYMMHANLVGMEVEGITDAMLNRQLREEFGVDIDAAQKAGIVPPADEDYQKAMERITPMMMGVQAQ